VPKRPHTGAMSLRMVSTDFRVLVPLRLRSGSDQDGGSAHGGRDGAAGGLVGVYLLQGAARCGPYGAGGAAGGGAGAGALTDRIVDGLELPFSNLVARRASSVSVIGLVLFFALGTAGSRLGPS